MKKQPKNKVLFLIPVGVILAGAVIFLCTRGNENDSVCKENVARLQALENSDISQTEEQLQALKHQNNVGDYIQAAWGREYPLVFSSPDEANQADRKSVV